MRATTYVTLGILAAPALCQQPNELLVLRKNGEFGSTVAIAGDVDADGVNDTLVWEGYLYPLVHVHSGATGQLLHSFLLEGRGLAGLCDLDGDGHDDFAIGSPHETVGLMYNIGAVSVYSGATFTLLYQVFGQTQDQNLGWSLTSAGDVDGDGKQDLLAGAPGTDQGPPLWKSGGARLYSGASGALIRSYYATLLNQGLGASVANAGDLDGDGVPDQVIGSPNANGQVGRATTYSGANGTILAEIDGVAAGDQLGYSVAGIDDGRVLVGAPGHSYPSGSAFLHDGVTGAHLLTLTGATTSNGFGHAVSRIGDLDQDGVQDLLIGAPYAVIGGQLSVGQATIHNGLTGSEIARFDGKRSHSRMGFAVAATGDHDGDGKPDILVGAPLEQKAFLVGFNPYLRASHSELSSSLGASVGLELSFPNVAALEPYKVLISATGAGPTLHGVEIPLTLDSMVINSYQGNYPIPTYSGLQGGLDASGNASASFDVPAGLSSSMIGRHFWMAAIVEPSGSLPTFSSVGVELTVVP